MTTARQVFEHSLIELNKAQAPSLLLEDFVYFLNKAILQIGNKNYNPYDLNQQIDDNLAVLRVLDYPIALTKQGNYYKGNLPDAINSTPENPIYTYFHILNCKVEFIVKQAFGCFAVNDTYQKSAARLTSDASKIIEDNHYFKPSYKKPYFYRDNTLLEIRSGKTTIMEPSIAYIDYLRVPTYVVLTQEQLDSVADSSQVLEFPDYICQEITNELVKLLLENGSDPRLQSNIPVSQSIAEAGQIKK